MRTIKLRGKAKNFLPDKRRFVYGSLSDWGDGRLSIRWRVISSKTAWKTCGVIPETVGQFTGLLDKNGREIYEGDILGCPEDNYFLHEVVILSEGCFMVKDDYTTTPMFAIDAQYRIVIGNIHDNPELISDK